MVARRVSEGRAPGAGPVWLGTKRFPPAWPSFTLRATRKRSGRGQDTIFPSPRLRGIHRLGPAARARELLEEHLARIATARQRRANLFDDGHHPARLVGPAVRLHPAR